MYVIIPARYDSTRLPGKPLADVAGKPLIERVYECARASGARTVVIATDDERIRRAAEGFGARVCLTSPTHRSGTDRVGEAVAQLALAPDAIVVNLQGDEPLVPPGLIAAVAGALGRDPQAVVATACYRLCDARAFRDPNVVKVVLDRDGRALYFSRAPIPWPREQKGPDAPAAYGHIGLYAYRAGFLARFTGWGPCPVEEIEQLEQLRVLWHGERIAVHVAAEAPARGVDTPEDLERVRRHFSDTGPGG